MSYIKTVQYKVCRQCHITHWFQRNFKYFHSSHKIYIFPIFMLLVNALIRSVLQTQYCNVSNLFLFLSIKHKHNINLCHLHTETKNLKYFCRRVKWNKIKYLKYIIQKSKKFWKNYLTVDSSFNTSGKFSYHDQIMSKVLLHSKLSPLKLDNTHIITVYKTLQFPGCKVLQNISSLIRKFMLQKLGNLVQSTKKLEIKTDIVYYYTLFSAYEK